MDLSKLKRFADLTERKKAIEAEEKAIKAEMDALEPIIIGEMADAGLQNANINGRTYYISRRFFANPAEGYDKVSVSAALKSAGLGEYVTETYNSNSLAAYVRSVIKEATPEDLQAAGFDENAGIDVLETYELRMLLPKPLRDVLVIGDTYLLISRGA
jgi:hypothetical protein